ncbi:MAG: hypothetical protein PHZ26_00480 [Candidatus Gracilibacteria bacterium]|nr:hypothetical protein [Candidatus Gracilibacteria bacterium]MDD2908213.1 hypothetical protein [Candidatus Gracilibacteria bacterium]
MNNINDILSTTVTVIGGDNLKIVTSTIIAMVIGIISEKSFSIGVLKTLPIKTRTNDREINKNENEFKNNKTINQDQKENKKPSMQKVMNVSSEHHKVSAQLENDYYQSKLKYRNK